MLRTRQGKREKVSPEYFESTRSRLLQALVLVLAAVALPNSQSDSVFAVTTTYAFSNPPDSVFVSTQGSGSNQWPSQILDTKTGFEAVQGVLIDNQINNSIFFDSNAVQVVFSTRMNGKFAWGDPRNNGIADPSILTIDFTDRVGGLPLNVSFDFAINQNVTVLPVQIFDATGDMQNINAPRSGTFSFGSGTGSEGRATLTASGIIDNIAKVRLVLPVDVFAGLQVGVDNMTFDSGYLLGDYDHNSKVDAADYVVWRKNGLSSQDYQLWRSHFGNTSGSASVAGSNTAAVPEPSPLVLLFLGTASSLPRRSRK